MSCCISNFCCCCHPPKVADLQYKASYKSFEHSESIGKMLILLNPNSGSGSAWHIFEHHLKPFLQKSKINYEAVITEYAGHASQVLAARSDLASFTALVIISGDGLVFEAINGMVSSAHSPAFPPIAIVPCGSGNALLASVFHARGITVSESKLLDKSVEVVCSPLAVAVPVNLVYIQTPGKKFASFLSVGWGIIADIDIESERFRKLCGGNRFLVQAVCRLAKASPRQRTDPPVKDCKYSPVYKASDALSTTAEPVSISNSKEIENEFISSSSGQTLALDQQIPANWTSIEDEFVLVYAVYLSHISTQAYYMPKAQLNEPTIWLTYILKSDLPSRLALYHFLNSMEHGTHLDADFCHTIPVSALRLECQGGKVVVDGELIECDKIQADVSTKTFNVVSLE